MRTDQSRLAVLLVVLALTGCLKRGVTPIQTSFNKGVYHYSKGDYQAAIGDYRMALEEDPGDYRARFNLAEALEAAALRRELEGEPDGAEELRREAEEHYLRLLAEDGDHLRAAVNLAAREFQRGDEDAAVARLEEAIARHPRATLPRVALGAHRLRQARQSTPELRRELLDEAIRRLEEARHRDPTGVDANMLLGHAWAARARHAPEGERDALYGRARESYEKALERDQEDLATVLALARLERQTGRLRRAEHWLRRALYARPDLLAAHLLLARTLSELGDLEGATLHLWRGREIDKGRWSRMSEEEYRQRLLELYQRLIEEEQGAS
jgi:tetratricopeptide (TPR) repeat protein